MSMPGQDGALSWVTAGGAIVRAGLGGAFALIVIFIVVWSVAQLPYGPGDLFIMLFTTASPASTDALQEGVLFAALVGFVAGGLVALGLIGFSFVQTAPLERNRDGQSRE